MSAVLDSIQAALGKGGFIPSSECAPWERDWLNRFGVRPLGIVRPASTDELSKVLKICHASRVSVIPQGGNTGLCAAAVANHENSIVVLLSRMNRIGAVDQASGSVLVDAGVVLEKLHSALEGTGLSFPLHLGSEGTAQIGGLIGTNAGGNQAFRFGMMQDLVLGLEVVLADGSVWNGLRYVQKDNAGYQLRRIFCGSEGTLGIVTRAVLKLKPAPKQFAAALLAFPDYESATEFFVKARSEADAYLNALEFFSDFGLELVLKHLNTVAYPLESRSACYMLFELSSSSEKAPLENIMMELIEWGMENGLIADGSIAASEAQRTAFWKLREEQPEGQRREGVQLKNDISVPPGRIAEFISEADSLCQKILSGVRINPFGHLGDGNIHFNLSPPANSSDFSGKEAELGLALASLATDFGGSFAAEHGLGRTKIYYADQLRPPSERQLMKQLKAAFDPQAILNPGIILE